jgi:hypothetical protein
LSGSQLYAAGPIDPQQPRVVQEPTDLKRNVEISGEIAPYRLNFLNDPNLPIIGVFTQAPTTELAIRLADASISALSQYVENLQQADNVPRGARVVIRRLGQAHGGVVNGSISKMLPAMIFTAVFVFWCVLLLVAARFRKSWRASKAIYASLSPPNGAVVTNGNGHGPDSDSSAVLRQRLLEGAPAPVAGRKPDKADSRALAETETPAPNGSDTDAADHAGGVSFAAQLVQSARGRRR